MKIVANGGLAPSERRAPIDRFAMDFSGKEKPEVLLVPTPKARPEIMAEALGKAIPYFRELGANVVALYSTFDSPPSRNEIAHKVGTASIINVFGGDTLRAMERFKEWGVDEELRAAAKRDTVLTGPSAGAITWFTKGHSDSLSYRVAEGEPWEYIMVEALGIEPGVIVPHYNTNTKGGEARRTNFARMVRSHYLDSSLPVYGIDNRAAVVVHDKTTASITVDDTHRVHVINPEDGQPYETLDVIKINHSS